LADRGWTRNWQTTAAAMIAGTAIIYLLGVAWLSQLIGFDKAVQFGLVPFIYGDILKLVIAAVSVPFMWKLVAKLTARK
jgi:biotin transport system substrate-specific component